MLNGHGFCQAMTVTPHDRYPHDRYPFPRPSLPRVEELEITELPNLAAGRLLAPQAAQQERDRLEKEADAYANRVLASARGEAAAVIERSEAYRAEAVNTAEGEAARFNSVYDEYIKAPEVTRRRMYLETMEKVLGNVNKVILDGEAGQGVVPYLPLDQLKNNATTGGTAARGDASGGTN